MYAKILMMRNSLPNTRNINSEMLFSKIYSEKFCKIRGKIPVTKSFLNPKTPLQMFASDFCEIFHSSCFIEHMWTVATVTPKA